MQLRLTVDIGDDGFEVEAVCAALERTIAAVPERGLIRFARVRDSGGNIVATWRIVERVKGGGER